MGSTCSKDDEWDDDNDDGEEKKDSTRQRAGRSIDRKYRPRYRPAQKTDESGSGGGGGGDGGGGGSSSLPTLNNALLREIGITRSLISLTSVLQTFRLLITCKELHAAEKDVFHKHKLPAVCNMRSGWGGQDVPYEWLEDMSSGWSGDGNEFKLYRAMVETPNSHWLEYLDTSGVKELRLPQARDQEMLIMFDGKRFSELRTLDLSQCENITDTSVRKVARGCSNLKSLNLRGCVNINNIHLGGCSNLQSLDLADCWRITDACLAEVGRGGCSNLQSLNLEGCFKITNTSLYEVARGCLKLETLNLRFCRNITSACKNALRQSHPNLQLRN